MANCIRCGRRLPLLSFGKLRNVCKWCQAYDAAHKGEQTEVESGIQPVIRRPWRRATHDPIIMYAIFGINVAVFLAMTLAGASVNGATVPELLHWGANAGPLTVDGQWWRLVTCMFLHIGFLHIMFNMWCLWDLGQLAEAMYGHWTFAAIYLLTGIAGSLASIAWRPIGVSAGASGAIFGIAGALIASFKLGEFSAPREQIRAILRSVVFFAGFNLVFGAIASRTDNAAHLGGFVIGLIMGALVAKAAPDPDNIPRRLVIVLLVVALLMGGAYYLSRTRPYRVQQAFASVLTRAGQ